MAELKVEVLEIENVVEHPNADRLDLATVLGYQVVVGRGQYKPGDCAVYFPVDSILPTELQDCIFKGGKMKLSKDRVRAARIRGAMSFGLLVDVPKIKSYMMRDYNFKVKKWHIYEGADLTSDLGVTKYEPPVRHSPQRNCNAVPKRDHHPDFERYHKIQHAKRNTKAMETYPGKVVAVEKIHGTNFRCGWVPFVPRTFAQKLKNIFLRFLGKPKQFEFVYGSHNVQLQDRSENAKTFYSKNVYAKAVEDFNLREKTEPGELWYFEIFGPGIQKNYSYGLKEGEIDIRVIDIRENGKFMDWWQVRTRARDRELESAPTVIAYPTYGGCSTFDLDLAIEDLNSYKKGEARRSMLDKQTPMEGFVLRPYEEEVQTFAGRYVFKLHSDEYLLNRSNTDNH